MNGLIPSFAMISAVDEPDHTAGDDTGEHARDQAELRHGHRRDAAGQRDGRADREIEAAADNHERHADGDHRHDRGLHQNVGEVERRQEAAGQHRRDHAQQQQRDQRALAEKLRRLRHGGMVIRRSPRAAACSSKPSRSLQRP